MNIELNKMPKKAYRNKNDINNILSNAEDKMYCIIQVDYNNGLIRFESLQHESLFINLYTSTLTITIENREEGERNNQYHFKNLSVKAINKIFNSPKKFINNEI